MPYYQVNKKRKRESESESNDTATAPRIPRGTLTLKAFDPKSGVTLKFKTDKSADVGRMIAGLGRMGRYMAALSEKADGMVQYPCVGYIHAHLLTALDVHVEDATSGIGTPAVEKGDAVKEAATTASADLKQTNVPKKKKKGKK